MGAVVIAEGAAPIVCCPRCEGTGKYYTEVESWEDYSPHGGFMAVNVYETACPCGAVDYYAPGAISWDPEQEVPF